ncbi:MAG: hypothetical protein JO150_00450 [Acidobacteriaceae bacterium]|nr:hypothetical protein [Acidobacteriaceae bacterium]
MRGRPRARDSGDGDGAIVTHNTLSADTTHVQVFYPFHPLYGYRLRVLRRPQRGDGAVSVIDPAGKRLKIPVWMLTPVSAHVPILPHATLHRESLLQLALLLPHQTASGSHDKLRPPSLDGDKEGHHATAVTPQPDSKRRGTRARRGDNPGRTDRPHGSPAGDRSAKPSKENR